MIDYNQMINIKNESQLPNDKRFDLVIKTLDEYLEHLNNYQIDSSNPTNHELSSQ